MKYRITNRSGLNDDILQAAVSEELDPLPAEVRHKYFLCAMQEVARRLGLDMDATVNALDLHATFYRRSAP